MVSSPDVQVQCKPRLTHMLKHSKSCAGSMFLILKQRLRSMSHWRSYGKCLTSSHLYLHRVPMWSRCTDKRLQRKHGVHEVAVILRSCSCLGIAELRAICAASTRIITSSSNKLSTPCLPGIVTQRLQLYTYRMSCPCRHPAHWHWAFGTAEGWFRNSWFSTSSSSTRRTGPYISMIASATTMDVLWSLENATGINWWALVAFHPQVRVAREKLQWASMHIMTLQENIAHSLFGILQSTYLWSTARRSKMRSGSSCMMS